MGKSIHMTHLGCLENELAFPCVMCQEPSHVKGLPPADATS